MTIIDKLLVLFDDQKNRKIDEVRNIYTNYTHQILSSAMGRLVSRGWLEKTKSSFQITKNGREVVSLNLDSLKTIEQKKNEEFYLIMFKIPEKSRIARDILRISLRENGFGQLHNSIWLSVKGESKRLGKAITELNIKKNIISFPIKTTKEKQSILIKNCLWNFKQINNFYKDFIKFSNDFLKRKDKNAIFARNLVYQYASIVHRDPLLDKVLCPDDFSSVLALTLYKKIRKYCY